MAPSERLRRLLGDDVAIPDHALENVLGMMADVLVNDADADDYGHVQQAAQHGAAHAQSVGLVTREAPPPFVLAELLTGYWLWLRSQRS